MKNLLLFTFSISALSFAHTINENRQINSHYRHLISGGDNPIYYEWGWCTYFDLSDEKKKIVQEKRKSIGLTTKSVKCSTFGKRKIIK